MRQTVASRLKTAQNTCAMLTTFNEINMGLVSYLNNQQKVIENICNRIKQKQQFERVEKSVRRPVSKEAQPQARIHVGIR